MTRIRLADVVNNYYRFIKSPTIITLTEFLAIFVPRFRVGFVNRTKLSRDASSG